MPSLRGGWSKDESVYRDEDQVVETDPIMNGIRCPWFAFRLGRNAPAGCNPESPRNPAELPGTGLRFLPAGLGVGRAALIGHRHPGEPAHARLLEM